jgi:hypothetical protein
MKMFLRKLPIDNRARFKRSCALMYDTEADRVGRKVGLPHPWHDLVYRGAALFVVY